MVGAGRHDRRPARCWCSTDVSASDVRCYELDVATGKLADLTLRPAGGTAACEIAGYMPNERAVLMLSDLEGRHAAPVPEGPQERRGARAAPGAGRASSWTAPGPTTRAPTCSPWRNEDGYGALSVYTLPDFKPVPLPPMERGLVVPVGASAARRWSGRSATPAPPAWPTPPPSPRRQGQGDAGHAPADLDRGPGHRPRRASRCPSWCATRPSTAGRSPRSCSCRRATSPGAADPVRRRLPRRPRGPAPAGLQRHRPVPALARLRHPDAQRARQHRLRARVPDARRLQGPLGQRARRRGRRRVAGEERLRRAGADRHLRRLVRRLHVGGLHRRGPGAGRARRAPGSGCSAPAWTWSASST